MLNVINAKRLEDALYSSTVARKSFFVGPLATLGLDLARFHSLQFRHVVESVFRLLSDKYPDARVAVAAYGSASREEMAAHSDADVLVITSAESRSERTFRKDFARLLDQFGFAKVDIPNWGTIADLEQLAQVNIVEGNQVLESEVIIGDAELVSEFEKMKRRASSVERAISNLVFQKYCYDHYYAKRKKTGLINIKYSHGGTRDLLFFVWIAKLEALRRGDRAEIRTLLDALDYLELIGDISKTQKEKLSRAASLVILLRSEVLKTNHSTTERGLSFYNPKSTRTFRFSNILSLVFESHDQMARAYKKCSNVISVMKSTLIKHTFSRYLEAESQLLMKVARRPSSEIGTFLNSDNRMTRLICIWEMSLRGRYPRCEGLVSGYISSDLNKLTWEETASLVANEDLGTEQIKKLTSSIISKPHFGYILKMVAQHPNTPREVLETIAKQASGERYKELARIALSKGVNETNFQV